MPIEKFAVGVASRALSILDRLYIEALKACIVTLKRQGSWRCWRAHPDAGSPLSLRKNRCKPGDKKGQKVPILRCFVAFFAFDEKHSTRAEARRIKDSRVFLISSCMTIMPSPLTQESFRKNTRTPLVGSEIVSSPCILVHFIRKP